MRYQSARAFDRACFPLFEHRYRQRRWAKHHVLDHSLYQDKEYRHCGSVSPGNLERQGRQD